MVSIVFHGRFQHLARISEIKLEIEPGLSIKSLINIILSKYPDLKTLLFDDNNGHKLKSRLVILVDGHSIKLLNGLRTKLSTKDSVTFDRIDFISPVGGG